MAGKMRDNVLIIGSGGREHSLGQNIGKSRLVEKIFYAPGNAGTTQGKGINLCIDGAKRENFPQLIKIVNRENIRTIIVGPEVPLDWGIVDLFYEKGITNVLGPSRKGARLESDKFYSSDLMKKLNIPQADNYKAYNKVEIIDALNLMKKENRTGVVLKAAGLHAGKGVRVYNHIQDALNDVNDFTGNFGERVLISERLFGQEFSVFGISNGKKVYPIPISFQDHKPLLDGDLGPNTGGMGAYGPAPVADVKMVKYVADNMMTPIIQKMAKDGNPYVGFMYAGMMITEQGPKVIEYNVRLGDPETQPLTMMLHGNLYVPIRDALRGKPIEHIDIRGGAACCVVMASEGYPGNYSDQKGKIINGLNDIEQSNDLQIFHAGTKINGSDILINGGRVLGITAYSSDGIEVAQREAYEIADFINEKNLGMFHYRKDIAMKAINR